MESLSSETSLFLQFFEGLDGEEESSPAGLQLPLVLGDELLHLGLQHQVRVVHLVAASLPGGGEVNRAEINQSIYLNFNVKDN